MQLSFKMHLRQRQCKTNFVCCQLLKITFLEEVENADNLVYQADETFPPTDS